MIGENGAGKSTLLKLACGLVAPDAGSVAIDGQPLSPHTPRAAIARGIGMVQQHFALVEAMTVLENVMLGAEPLRGGLLDEAEARRRLAEVTRELGVTLDPAARVRELGIGDRQRLEIARVVYKGARVVVLDEPTAVLVPREADALYEMLARLVAAGRTVIVVTHKLDEVVAHAQTVRVMRHGQLVLSRDVDHDDAERELRALAAAVMGEDAPAQPAAPPRACGTVVLDLDDVRLGRALRGLTLKVHAGEIVGVAGVEGNGQRELTRLIAGLEHADSGRVDVAAASVVHEDRHQEGLVLDAPVADNLVLGEHAALSRFGVLDASALRATAHARLTLGAVEPGDPSLLARGLSGGNQQKVVVARALARTGDRAKLLVAAHPTRGVDIGAARLIHERIRAAASRGVGVLVISSDLHELRALSDRIAVMVRGRIAQQVDPGATNERLGELMLGEEGAA